MPATLHYLDSSALVKRYVPERGSAWIAELIRDESVTISDLSDAEIASALARRVRESVIPRGTAITLFQAYLRDKEEKADYETVELTSGIAQAAADLLLTAPTTISLRTLDALHLASARRAFVEARRHGIPTGNFITADRGLLAAATWAGLPVLNPEDYP